MHKEKHSKVRSKNFKRKRAKTEEINIKRKEGRFRSVVLIQIWYVRDGLQLFFHRLSSALGYCNQVGVLPAVDISV